MGGGRFAGLVRPRVPPVTGTPYLPSPDPGPRRQRRPSASTSAAGISQYLRRRDICPVNVRSDIFVGAGNKQEWCVVVTCLNGRQADQVWVALREGGYNLGDRYHNWVIVKEKQT